MDKETLEMFKNSLQEQLEDLTLSFKQTVSRLIGQENLHADPLDRASSERDQGFLLRIRDRESHVIDKIRDALERIEDGSFGICESCGDDIPIERLKVRPVAIRCIKCKVKEEQLEARHRN